MQLSLNNQRVLITAGAAGIGRAMAATFRQAGARVHICDISQNALEEAREQLGVTTTLCDVSNLKQVDLLFADVRSQLGGLDVLVNNAGIAGPTGKVEDLEVEDWRRCIDIDLNSMFYVTRLAMPMLKAARGGSIINMSSSAGRLGFPYRTPYASAKWAVVGFTRSLSMEVGTDNIRVNAIQPGAVEGDRIDRVIQAKADAMGISFDAQKAISVERTSMRTLVSAQDIANMALYLASDLAQHITGQALSVCAGAEMLG
ncbi:MAG: SDR family oxidoreductase [Betaproteobacteria bacterium]|nr:SDR family oxidoreductase [Betaproteobacteria bacterium]